MSRPSHDNPIYTLLAIMQSSMPSEKWTDRHFSICVFVCMKEKETETDLLQDLIVEFESPELQSGGQGTNGGQAGQELLSCSQRNIGIGLMGLLDLQLLLLCGDHRQNFLLHAEGGDGQMYPDTHGSDVQQSRGNHTSIPSLLMANSSKLRMAALMTCTAGSTVMPMLMALLLFGSRTRSSDFLVSGPFCTEISC